MRFFARFTRAPIARIEVLTIHPGDVVVLETDRPLRPEQAEALARQWSRLDLGQDVRVCVVSEAKVRVLRAVTLDGEPIEPSLSTGRQRVNYRLTAIVSPDGAEDARDLFDKFSALLRSEGYAPEEVLTFEFERTAWEPVFASVQDASRTTECGWQLEGYCDLPRGHALDRLAVFDGHNITKRGMAPAEQRSN